MTTLQPREVFSNVLVVGFEHVPPRGGQGVYSQELVARAPGIQLFMGTWKMPTGIFSIFSGLIFVWRHLWFSCRVHFTLPRYIRHRGITVIHLQTGPSGVFLWRRLPVRVIATSHHSYSLSLRYKRTWRNTLYYLIMAWLERRTLSRCDRILALSEFAKQDLIENSQVPADRVLVRPIPPAEYFRPLPVKKKDMLLFVGRMDRQKGIQELLEAMRDPAITTTLYLVGWSTAALRQQIAVTPELQGKIIIHPYMAPPELAQMYNEARLTIMPSYFETLGLVALESLACGTPCLVGPSTGAAEIVKNIDPSLILSAIHPSTIARAIREHLDHPRPLPPLPLRWADYMREYQRLVAYP